MTGRTAGRLARACSGDRLIVEGTVRDRLGQRDMTELRRHLERFIDCPRSTEQCERLTMIADTLVQLSHQL